MADAPGPTASGGFELMKSVLGRIAAGHRLSVAESEEVFDVLMSGGATSAQIGGLLMALRIRGETIEEITGAAQVMRTKAVHLEAPPGAIDTCGTGGDGAGTYNISTATAFVVAACDVPVAKHGNRALSSKSGSADVLAALGVNVMADMALVRESLWTANLGFLMAPRHNDATRHVAAARTELGTRTIFNLLGPLSNPAGTTRQVVGVYSDHWVHPLAEVLGRLGAERAWVVHGADGLDELTTTTSSLVAEWHHGDVRVFEVTPEAAGLARARPEDLRGGDAAENAAALLAILKGKRNAYRDIVILNAAAALIVADKAEDLAGAAAMAAAAIDGGRALAVLERLMAITNRPVPPS
jgi:anthranilate phosphoribosyltransferase